MRPFTFPNRNEAGRALAAELSRYADRPEVVVLALPRGGVPIGFEITRTLHAPLDIFLVRKLGVPGHEELAMGAIASGGVRVLNEVVIHQLEITEDQIEEVAHNERLELERREQAFRRGVPPVLVSNHICILVDDGLATGSTMRAAIIAIRQQRPAHLVIAVPVGAEETCRQLRAEADEVVCAATPWPFRAVGQWYEDFPQASDDEVHELLDESRRELYIH